MSKKRKHDQDHKHKYEYEYDQEYIRQNIVPKQRILAIILLLQALSERMKENNKLIEVPLVNVDSKEKYKKRDTEEREKRYKNINDFIEIYEKDATQNIETMDGIKGIEEYSVNKEEIVEDYIEDSNISKVEDVSCGIIPSSKVTSCKTTMLHCNPSESLECYSSFQSGVIKIPVILAHIQMKVCVEALIKFPEPVFQIKALDRSVLLNKCQLILGTDKLFVKGLIQENIEYATATTIKENTISGNIKKSTFNIPFQCSTKVSFNIHPKIPKSSYNLELEIINPNIDTNNLDINEKSYEHFEFLNDKVLCKIDSTEIMEIDKKEEMKPLKNTMEKEKTFSKIRKKMVLILKISLLQEQKTFL